MIFLPIIKKIILSLITLVFFYLLRKILKGQPKRKSNSLHFDKGQVIDGEIVGEK